jgi:hypothetical protein
MPRLQRGGFLEPLQKTPPFKYTTNPERIAWTSMIYPYAPYFFNLFKEIPWADFYYEDEEVIAKTDMKLGPYGIMGGCYFELINKEYNTVYPSKEYFLHEYVDPTGDIDVVLNGLIVESKNPEIEFNEYYIDSNSETPYAFTKAYLNWLLDHIEIYFKKIAYNFPEWFPNSITDFNLVQEKVKNNTNNVSQFKYSDFSTIRQVGPFIISAEYLGSEPRIQVSMLHKVPDGNIVLDHMIELILEGTVNGEAQESIFYTFRKLPTLQLYVNELEWEIAQNNAALSYRIENPPDLFYKFANHIYRALYWCWFSSLIHTNPSIIAQIADSSKGITWSINKLLEDGILYTTEKFAKKRPLSIPYILDFIRRLPEQFRTGTFYKITHQICESIDKTDKECGLEKPTNGGSRRTRKQKKRRNDRVYSRRGRK